MTKAQRAKGTLAEKMQDLYDRELERDSLDRVVVGWMRIKESCEVITLQMIRQAIHAAGFPKFQSDDSLLKHYHRALSRLNSN